MPLSSSNPTTTNTNQNTNQNTNTNTNTNTSSLSSSQTQTPTTATTTLVLKHPPTLLKPPSLKDHDNIFCTVFSELESYNQQPQGNQEFPTIPSVSSMGDNIDVVEESEEEEYEEEEEFFDEEESCEEQEDDAVDVDVDHHHQDTVTNHSPSSTTSTIEQQISSFNHSTISQLSNGYFNLHRLLADSEGMLTVPFLPAKTFEVLCQRARNSTEQSQQQQSQQQQQQFTKIWIGQLPFVGNLENLVRLMIYSIAGVFNIYRVDVHDKNATPDAHIKVRQQLVPGQKRSANSNAANKVTCPLVAVTVDANDAEKIITRIDRRVVIDQTAFQLAVTPDSIKSLSRYEKMMKASHSQRFQCRPYSAVTATRENPQGVIHRKGEAPHFKNMRNPVCVCQLCSTHFRVCVDYCSLFNFYLPQLALATPSRLFSLNDLVEVHSNMTPETVGQLTEAQRRCTSEVSDESRRQTQQTMSKKWFEDGYRFGSGSGNEEFDDFSCRDQQQYLTQYYYNYNYYNQQ